MSLPVTVTGRPDYAASLTDYASRKYRSPPHKLPYQTYKLPLIQFTSALSNDQGSANFYIRSNLFSIFTHFQILLQQWSTTDSNETTIIWNSSDSHLSLLYICVQQKGMSDYFIINNTVVYSIIDKYLHFLFY